VQVHFVLGVIPPHPRPLSLQRRGRVPAQRVAYSSSPAVGAMACSPSPAFRERGLGGEDALIPQCPWFARPARIVPCGHCSPTPAAGGGGAAAPPHGVPAPSEAMYEGPQSQVSMYPGIWGLERAQEGNEIGLFLGGEPNVETVVVEGDHVVERGG